MRNAPNMRPESKKSGIGSIGGWAAPTAARVGMSMTSQRVNYDRIASEYDQRFSGHSLEDRRTALLELAGKLRAERTLEVGCGTGRWLSAMHPEVPELCGLDPSMGMLNQARQREIPIKLVCGHAERLPFENSYFDMVFCVNAIHHFESPRAFVGEAFRVLQVGGALAIIGSDPHGRRDSWYGYHYFGGTYETDLRRFPAWEEVSEWMSAEGFERIELREVERIDDPKHGRKVLDDPFLRKNSCSQLALLTEEAYTVGVRRIEAALKAAEAQGEGIDFPSELSIGMLTGYRVSS